jgi:hypothetical protein
MRDVAKDKAEGKAGKGSEDKEPVRYETMSYCTLFIYLSIFIAHYSHVSSKCFTCTPVAMLPILFTMLDCNVFW